MAMATSAIIGLVGAGLSAAGQQQAGKEAGKIANEQAKADAKTMYVNSELAKIDALRTEENAYKEADKIREVALRLRSEARATQGGSGTLVGEGSNEIVLDDITRRAEADALATVMDGIYNKVNKQAEARWLKQSGDVRMQSGASQGKLAVGNASNSAGMTLLSGVGTAYSSMQQNSKDKPKDN